MVKVAVASDDGEKLKKDHFGEAKYFFIYEISEKEIKFLERRENTSKEERFHGDPEKAKSIGEILRDVDILLGFQMGPNVQRMKERFLTVISRYEDIKENLEIIKENIERFEDLVKEKGKIVIINKGPKIVVV